MKNQEDKMNIMVGTCNFDAEGLLEAAVLKHARAFNAKIYLVRSMEVSESIPREVFAKAEKLLEKGKSFFTRQGVKCESHFIETGLTTGENLIQFAKNNQIDQIIIGVRSRSKIEKLIFGSTAQYVILNSSCPVLCVNVKKT